MVAEITRLKDVINPEEKVLVWRVGEYIVVKKVEPEKVVKKIGEVRETLQKKGMLLSDDGVIALIKEAREEWRE
ncbi:MAG: hypothetical protein GXO66_02710 [Euryarchaeota archaeon]|nr:hypothetical protein [Euryarchaeota archaeon]